MDIPSLPGSAINRQQTSSTENRGSAKQQLPPFSKGQLLSATVHAKVAENFYELQIGGRKTVAHSMSHLTIGQQLELKVMTTTPHVQLQAVGDQLTRNITANLHLLGSQKLFFTNLANLESLLQSGGLQKSSQQALSLFSGIMGTNRGENLPAGDQLQLLHQRLGLNMEQLLAMNKADEAMQTLKFALLEAQQQGKGSAPELSSQLLQTIDLYQMLQSRLAGESLFFLPLPLPFLDQGYLLVTDDAAGSENSQTNNKKPVVYTLLLQLEGLGNLKIDIKKTDGAIDIRFYAEDREKMLFLRENRDELTELITSSQFQSAQFLTGAIEPIREILAKFSKNSAGMIDTRA